MKKKIGLMVFAFMLFASVVSASSINGDYQGNPIVKLKSNGMVLPVEDTPAIIYDGRTMVPIYMLKQLGADVTWDGNTYSVDVKLPVSDKVTEDDIDLIKMLATVMHHYKFNGSLGEIIKALADNFSLTYDQINANDTSAVNTANSRLNNAINKYNDMIPMNQTVIDNASRLKIDVRSSFNDILASYIKAIEFFRASYVGLEKYSASKSSSDFYEYLNNSKKGFDEVYKGIKISDDGYYKFLDMIKNY